MTTEKAERQSNFELLRIVAMLLIISFHYCYKGGFEFDGFSLNLLTVKTFWLFGEPGVNLFLLITGYFTVNQDFKPKKLASMLSVTLIYHLLTFFAAVRLGRKAPPKKITDWLMLFFPTLLNRYWFLTAYFVVYLLSPFFNQFIKTSPKRLFERLLLTLLSLYCVMPTFFGLFYSKTESFLYYNRMIWLCVVYLLGAYIRLYGLSLIADMKRAALTGGGALAFCMTFIVLAARHPRPFAALGVTEPAYFWPPNTIPMVLMSVGLFGCFLHLRLPYSRTVNRLASATAAVYIIHDGYLQGWWWKVVFSNARHQSSPYLLFHILFAALALFFGCTLLELCRQRLQRAAAAPLLRSPLAAGLSRRMRETCAGRILPDITPPPPYIHKYPEKDGSPMLKKTISGLLPKDGRLPYLCVFFLTFLLYVFLGLCMSNTPYPINIFFYSDNTRALADMSAIAGSHGRINVHPLFLLLVQPAAQIIDGFVNYAPLAVILLESFAGAMLVTLLMAILNRLIPDQRLVYLFTFIFAFSFLQLLFSASPETYIFAGLGLAAYWYFVLLASEREGSFTKKELFLLVFFGAATFGITLTNYISYLIGLGYLLWKRTPKPEPFFRNFMKINLLNAAEIYLLCRMQRFVWKRSPLFWTSIQNAVHGKKEYSEIKYIRWTFGFKKTVQWAKGIFLRPLVSPGVYWYAKETDVGFAEYSNALRFLLAVFYLVFLLSLIRYVYTVCKSRACKKHCFIAAVVLAYAFNIAFHYVYGATYPFLYAPHYLFLMIIVMAVSVNAITSLSVKKAVTGFLALFAGVEAVNNLVRFFETAQLAMDYAKIRFSMLHSIKGTLMVACLAAAGCLGLAYLERRHNVRLWARDYSEKTSLFCRNIAIYCVLTIICALFIAFSYRSIAA